MVVTVGALLGASPAALPCSYLTHEPHAIDPNAGLFDTDPPKPPRLLKVDGIKRGVGPDITGASTSCDDLGTLTLTMEAAEDQRTPPEEMGYRVQLAAGSLPDGLTLPAGPVRQLPLAEGDQQRAKLLFVWIDGATDEQEPLDFTLDITPVDRAGLEGGAARVRVKHPGSDGCGLGRSPSSGSLALLLAALMLLGARRRRRSLPTPASWRERPRGC